MSKRRIQPDKAAASVGGDPGWYAGIPTPESSWATCPRCGIKTTLIGQDGECLRCRLEKRKAAREAAV